MNNKLEFAVKMQGRTQAFAVQIVKFFSKLPKTEEGRILGRQLLRSATSVAANYRAVCRAKSDADFISKLGTVVEEADESLFWLELIESAGLCSTAQLGPPQKGSRRIASHFSNIAQHRQTQRKPIIH